METIDQICSALLALAALLLCYKTVYQVVGFFSRAKVFPKTDKTFEYAFVVAARNEAAVIAQLIESIHSQTCDQDKIRIYVVADNCTDDTAKIARSCGAIVYERFDFSRARKGYAMQFLFEQIQKVYGIDHVDAYFVFDADNLLAPNFVDKMNDAFALGNDIVTAYRNTKNFDTNWISAAYGIHFYRNSMALHRPRNFLGVGTHLTGTGYMIRSNLLGNGWDFTSFTEDDQITMRYSSMNYRVAFCEAAEFFDEQPTQFKTVYRQRLRWAKGRLNNFFRESRAAMKGFFRYRSFTCYDVYFHYFPYGIFSFIIGGIYPLITFVYGFIQPGSYDYSHMWINIASFFGAQYLFSLLIGLLTVIREHTHIRCPLPKLILYIILFPWFDMISTPISLIAIFKRVEWVPIPHIDSRRIHDLVD